MHRGGPEMLMSELVPPKTTFFSVRNSNGCTPGFCVTVSQKAHCEPAGCDMRAVGLGNKMEGQSQDIQRVEMLKQNVFLKLAKGSGGGPTH